jgi:PTS system ascorbate-specific IIA component
MLWRALCYADEPLDTVAARALGGAVQGVLAVAPITPSNPSAGAVAPDPACDQVDHPHQ